MHTCTCYVRMAELIEKAEATDLIPYNRLKEKLHESVNRMVVKDKENPCPYNCIPADFLVRQDSCAWV